MTRTTVRGLLFAVALAACSTTHYPTEAQSSVAQVTVKSITPASGTDLTESSVLQAEIEYAITPFDTTAEYYLAPLFDSIKGSGQTFNEFERLTDGWRLAKPAGFVQLSYPIARELRSTQLARPVRISFYVMVRTAAHKTLVIGKTEAVRFGPAV
jgi:hypothetical protein